MKTSKCQTLQRNGRDHVRSTVVSCGFFSRFRAQVASQLLSSSALFNRRDACTGSSSTGVSSVLSLRQRYRDAWCVRSGVIISAIYTSHAHAVVTFRPLRAMKIRPGQFEFARGTFLRRHVTKVANGPLHQVHARIGSVKFANRPCTAHSKMECQL